MSCWLLVVPDAALAEPARVQAARTPPPFRLGSAWADSGPTDARLLGCCRVRPEHVLLLCPAWPLLYPSVCVACARSGKYSYCRPEKSKFDEAFPLE